MNEADSHWAESSFYPFARIAASLRGRLTAVGIAFLLSAASVHATAGDIKVMISGGLSEAFKELVPQFEQATRNKVTTIRGPSMGETPQAIPNRLKRGEDADVLIMAGEALDKLAADGAVVSASRTPLANSLIGMAVIAGAAKPDISSVAALKQTLLNAKSVAYSDSASGVYIKNELFPRLGIVEQMNDKARGIPAEPVGAVVARGEAELGFQQLSELLPVPGITLVGKIPSEVQKMTVFSAGVASKSKNSAGAAELIKFLSSAQSAATIEKSGLEPVAVGAR
ncbi:MAG: extracellular solute-binding protein family 1 [Herminiimonas sp.]|nr:extracellular solute-binding protein family 1 [Herminiimonas sp.]